MANNCPSGAVRRAVIAAQDGKLAALDLINDYMGNDLTGFEPRGAKVRALL